MTHQHLNRSQLSQRYVDQSDYGIGCVIPPVLLQLGKDAALARWKRNCEEQLHEYSQWVSFLVKECLLDRKTAMGCARSVLPECTETRMLVSGNLRSWRNFFEMRCSKHSDVEIRRLACRVFELLRPEAPAVFADYQSEPVGDGTFSLSTEFKKI